MRWGCDEPNPFGDYYTIVFLDLAILTFVIYESIVLLYMQ